MGILFEGDPMTFEVRGHTFAFVLAGLPFFLVEGGELNAGNIGGHAGVSPDIRAFYRNFSNRPGHLSELPDARTQGCREHL